MFSKQQSHLLEFRFENHNKNIRILKQYKEQNDLFQINLENDDTENLDQIIEMYRLKKSDLISNKKLYLEPISSPNITQWQKNTTPAPVKAAFITHALAVAYREITEEELKEVYNKLGRRIDLEKMGLILPRTEQECYNFFFKLLNLAYFDKLIERVKIEEATVAQERTMPQERTMQEALTMPKKPNEISDKSLNLKKSKRSHLVIASIFIILAIFFGISMSSDPYIHFNDPVLEAVLKREVEGAIGKKIEGAVKKADALAVTSVTYDMKNNKTTQWCNNEPITDLTGIQAFKNLEVVNFRGNQIAEIGALYDLNKIEQLYIGSNKIINIEPLSKLKTLKRLAIDGNFGIKDVSDLQTLDNLELLNISYLDLESIEPITHLYQMKYLYMLGPTRADATVLTQMTSLEDLYMDDTKLTGGYEFLNDMPWLKHLNLSKNEIDNLNFISNLTLLEGLDVRENKIKEITPLIKLEHEKEIAKSTFKYLKLDHNEIASIEGISQLSEIQRLTLVGNPIENLNEAYILRARNNDLEIDFGIELQDFGSAITNAHDEVWYTFKPNETDQYSFYTLSDGDIQGALFDENREKLLSGWYNEGAEIRFYTEGVLEGGKTYLIKIRGFGETLSPYHFYVLGTKNTVDFNQIEILGVENHYVAK